MIVLLNNGTMAGFYSLFLFAFSLSSTHYFYNYRKQIPKRIFASWKKQKSKKHIQSYYMQGPFKTLDLPTLSQTHFFGKFLIFI